MKATLRPRPALPVEAVTGIFDDANSERLSAADTTHWWFRGKADVVGAVLRQWAPPDGWLLDVGAGSGGVTSMVAWNDQRRLAVEGSAPLVRLARRRGLAVAQGDVTHLPVRDHSVAAVCLLDVIEHLPEPVVALEEARRAVRRDGVVVVSVPAHEWLWSAADEELGHHRRYNRRLLREQLSLAGLAPLWVSHTFSWCVPAVWFARKVSKPSGAELGISPTSPAVDRVADALNGAERVLLSRTGLPFGTSVLAVAAAL